MYTKFSDRLRKITIVDEYSEGCNVRNNASNKVSANVELTAKATKCKFSIKCDMTGESKVLVTLKNYKIPDYIHQG